MKKFLITLVILGVGVGAAVGVYSYRKTGPVVQVTTLPVSRGDITKSVGATGTLEAVTTVTVGSQVSGIVKELHADFNDIVKKGKIIAKLDPTLFQTQIEQQEANLVRSQTEVDRLKVSLEDSRTKLKRAEGLAAKNLAPAMDLETAQVNVRLVEAQIKSSMASYSQSVATLNQAKVNLDNTVITAPIDGIVISRNVDVGQTVAASMSAPTLFIIAADLAKMQARASVDESDVGMIRPGQTARFRVDAYPTENFVGTVRQVRLQPVVVQNVVTYVTVIDVPNSQLKLKPGMTANVTIEIAQRTNALRVPNSALRFRPTSEMFLALNQAVPPELTQQGRGARGGQRGQGDQGSAQGRTGGPGGGQALAGQPAPPAPQAQAGPQAQPGQPGQTGPQSPQTAQRSGEQGGRESAAAGGRRGGGMDPEAAGRFQAQMANMTPEERARMMERFGNRQGGAQGDRGGPQGGSRAGGPGQQNAVSISEAKGQTIDSLFAPLPVEINAGRVYLYIDKQIKLARIRTGISDGTYTELIGEDLKEGQELVTDVSMGQARATTPTGPGQQRPGQSNPLMPGGGRGMGGPGR